MKYKFTTSMGSIIALFFFFGFSQIQATHKNHNLHFEDGTPYLVKNFNVHTPIHLTVQTSGGYINVQYRNSNKVRIEMYVQHHGRYLTPKDTDLGEYHIDISKSGNEVRAISRSKNRVHFGFWQGYSISFVIYTPKRCDCELHTSGGFLKLSGIEGEIDARTSGGYISSDDITGNIQLHTSGGQIKLNHISGDIVAKTSGGSIAVNSGTGSLRLSTSGGPIKLDGISGEVDARTSGGSIHANVLRVDNRLSLRTSGGNITANIPTDKGYDLDLSGSSVHTNLKNFSGTMKRDAVQGTVMGGGPKIILKTSGGSIRLNQD